MRAQIGFECARTFHAIGNGLRPQRAFGQADQGPRQIARHDPAVDGLVPFGPAVVEHEIEMDRAADHRRGQFDIGHAVIALDRPVRRGAALAGQRTLLQGVDHFGAFIRRGNGDITRHAAVHRASVAIKNAQGQDRPRAGIGHQVGLFGHQPHLRRDIGEIDIARQRGGHRAIGIAHHSHQMRGGAVQRNAAPDRHGIGMVGGDLGAVERNFGHGLTVGRQFHLLPVAVADRHADRRRTRIVIDRGKQEFGRPVTQRQPVDIGARSRLVADPGGMGLGVLAHRPGCARRHRSIEIGHFQHAALPLDKARNGAAGSDGGPGAIDEMAAFGQCRRRHLDHVIARHQTVEVIASVLVGDRIAAVFQHHAHPGNAVARSIAHASLIGNPPDKRHVVGQHVGHDLHHRMRRRGQSHRICNRCGVWRLSCRSILVNCGGIGDHVLRCGCHRAQVDRQHPPVGGELHLVGQRRAIDPHRLGADAQLPRRFVDHHHIALDIGFRIADGQRVEHHIALLRGGATGGLGDRRCGAGLVHRHIDAHRLRSGYAERGAIGPGADLHRGAVGAQDAGQVLRRNGRRRRIRRRRLYFQAILSRCDQREQVFARRQLERHAAAIDHRLACHHA